MLDDPWLRSGFDRAAFAYAVQKAVPAHLEEVRARTLTQVAKVRAAVRDRLTKQIAYWDARAAELREQATAGRQPRMNPDRAQARADELAGRLQARLADLARDEQLSAMPPVIMGAALVVPAGVVAPTAAAEGAVMVAPPMFSLDRRVVEDRAVAAVVAAEEARGWRPQIMARNNPGFDVRSEGPMGEVCFIEVKGRIEGAETFLVTRNEILHALNVPDVSVLAMVEVSPDGPGADRLRYLSRPFADDINLPFATTATMLSWPDYWDRGVAP